MLDGTLLLRPLRIFNSESDWPVLQVWFNEADEIVEGCEAIETKMDRVVSAARIEFESISSLQPSKKTTFPSNLGENNLKTWMCVTVREKISELIPDLVASQETEIAGQHDETPNLKSNVACNVKNIVKRFCFLNKY